MLRLSVFAYLYNAWVRIEHLNLNVHLVRSDDDSWSEVVCCDVIVFGVEWSEVVLCCVVLCDVNDLIMGLTWLIVN